MVFQVFVFNQKDLIEFLENHAQGVEVASYGRARDGFELPVDVQFWKSGYGGKYESVHTKVPKGTMIAVGDLEDLDVTNFEKTEEHLVKIDIYPTGHSGDFSDQKLDTLRDWFFSRSRVDNEVNTQTPISHAKKLTPEGLGKENFGKLVSYLADNMNLFKGVNDERHPSRHDDRATVVKGLLEGLSKTIRYTRLDDPAVAFQLAGRLLVEKENQGNILYNLTEENKIIILRTYKNGEKDLSPLDRAMIGRSYATKDGQPLGNRGLIDVSDVVAALYNDQPLPPYIRKGAHQGPSLGLGSNKA
jgi:hypothetical protein